jgi:hypothetical protein
MGELVDRAAGVTAGWLMGGFVVAAAGATPGFARVDWLLPAPLALALCCELALMVSVSPMVVAGPLMLVLGPVAGPETAPTGVGTGFAAPGLVADADGTLPVRTAPVAASAQPRLSTAVSKWIHTTMGA